MDALHEREEGRRERKDERGRGRRGGRRERGKEGEGREREKKLEKEEQEIKGESEHVKKFTAHSCYYKTHGEQSLEGKVHTQIVDELGVGRLLVEGRGDEPEKGIDNARWQCS